MATRTAKKASSRKVSIRSGSGQKLTPFLWFDHQAEEAVRHYCAIFKRSKVRHIARYGEVGPGKPGSVMTIDFQLEGQDFVALNGGPVFQFTPAISFVVNCEGQREVDYFWSRLSRGGRTDRCGWLVDKFGVSWQVVPTRLLELIVDRDPEVARATTAAMLKMAKLELPKLEKAAAQARKARRG
jgi:predicted 3-demethylubiquinone-9 3-methyltransferase (glyoxalase superfamily)